MSSDKNTRRKNIRNLSISKRPRFLPDPIADSISIRSHSSVKKLSRVSSTDDLPDINICISDTQFQDLKREHKRSIWYTLNKCLGTSGKMSQEEFDETVKRLYKCCLRGVKDLHELHIRRVMGLEILEELVKRAKPEYLTITHVIHITWSILSCIHHFRLRVRTDTNGIIAWSRRKKSEHCMKVYNKLIKLVPLFRHRIILNSILTFYKEGKLWEVEFGCTDMIIKLFEYRHYADDGLDDILFNIEVSTLRNVQEACYLTRVLYDIVKQVKWNKMPEYLLIKFLNMLESSISPRYTDIYNYTVLRAGIEICVKNIINNLSKHDLIKLVFLSVRKINENINNIEVITAMGNVCANAAQRYKMKTSYKSLEKGPLPIIFILFKTKKVITSLIGLKIWNQIIDRRNNADKLLIPKIFFQDCDFNLTITKCLERDKILFKKLRHLMYDVILNSFLICEDRTGLAHTYQVVALTLIEIPCGYTASCFVTVAMSLQEYALQLNSQDLVRSHHIHATVLSILSLICYIHKAEVFYVYVNTIMDRRAEWAPHLNPPLKPHYQYAQHHILWNKPDLFFEDWEARYGLWKGFRGRRIIT